MNRQQWETWATTRYGSIAEAKRIATLTGRRGGLTITERTKQRGFGTNRELARTAGIKGGKISKPTRKKQEGRDE